MIMTFSKIRDTSYVFLLNATALMSHDLACHGRAEVYMDSGQVGEV